MKKYIAFLCLLPLFSQCIISNTKYFAGVTQTQDKTYGYTAENPILVKNADLDHSIATSYYYISHLRTAAGNKLTLLKRTAVYNPQYKKPEVELVNRYTGMPINSNARIVDLYLLKPENEPDTIKLYINPYKKGKIFIPAGLTFKE